MYAAIQIFQNCSTVGAESQSKLCTRLIRFLFACICIQRCLADNIDSSTFTWIRSNSTNKHTHTRIHVHFHSNALDDLFLAPIPTAIKQIVACTRSARGYILAIIARESPIQDSAVAKAIARFTTFAIDAIYLSITFSRLLFTSWLPFRLPRYVCIVLNECFVFRTAFTQTHTHPYSVAQTHKHTHAHKYASLPAQCLLLLLFSPHLSFSCADCWCLVLAHCLIAFFTVLSLAITFFSLYSNFRVFLLAHSPWPLLISHYMQYVYTQCVGKL